MFRDYEKVDWNKVVLVGRCSHISNADLNINDFDELYRIDDNEYVLYESEGHRHDTTNDMGFFITFGYQFGGLVPMDSREARHWASQYLNYQEYEHEFGDTRLAKICEALSEGQRDNKLASTFRYVFDMWSHPEHYEDGVAKCAWERAKFESDLHPGVDPIDYYELIMRIYMICDPSSEYISTPPAINE